MHNFLKILFLLSIATCKSENTSKEIKIIKQIFDEDIRLVANINPKKEGYWEEPPNIILCKDAPYRLYRIEKAARFWKNLNHKLGDIKSSSQFEVCVGEDQKYIRNHIVIKLRGQKFDETKYAVTTNYKIANTENIIASVIQLQGFSTEIDWVLEHEIGHSLGWRHYNVLGHLMNDKAQLGGWNTKGLRLIKK